MPKKIARKIADTCVIRDDSSLDDKPCLIERVRRAIGETLIPRFSDLCPWTYVLREVDECGREMSVVSMVRGTSLSELALHRDATVGEILDAVVKHTLNTEKGASFLLTFYRSHPVEPGAPYCQGQVVEAAAAFRLFPGELHAPVEKKALAGIGIVVRDAR